MPAPGISAAPDLPWAPPAGGEVIPFPSPWDRPHRAAPDEHEADDDDLDNQHDNGEHGDPWGDAR